MEGLLDRLARCGEHDFPMVRIGLHYLCAAEYLDRAIGSRRLTGVSQDQEGVIYLEFGPGRRLPLFCPYCEGAAVIDDMGAFRRRWYGRQVQAFASYQATGEGQKVEVIGIIFSGSEPEEARTIEIGLKSVRQVEMPEPGTQPPHPRRSKGRRRRKKRR